MKTLILIRGLPGSGKSTLARAMREACAATAHWEADMYFTDNGKYTFDPAKLEQAHRWCQDAVSECLGSYTFDTVIVSNTFTQRWEMLPYFDMAHKYDAQVVILECKNQYGSIHGIPDVTFQRMKDRWEEISYTVENKYTLS
jgi:predicted kinase